MININLVVLLVSFTWQLLQHIINLIITHLVQLHALRTLTRLARFAFKCGSREGNVILADHALLVPTDCVAEVALAGETAHIQKCGLK